MKNRFSFTVILFFSVILFTGCGESRNRTSESMEEPSYAEASVIEIDENSIQAESAGARETEQTMENKNTVNEVVIRAHIKEINKDTMIISSETDEYPGAFFVEVPAAARDINTLVGGEPMIIHMANMNVEEQGMKKFLAISIRDCLQDIAIGNDLLLSSAPAISITDALSSTLNKFVLESGNYEWNYKDGNQITSLLACGSAPLDEIIR